jgi:hypothetical protein
MRIRALFVLLACTLFVEWSATPALAASPISPNNRPTAVPNRTNGEMPDSDLVNVAPGCRAYRAAGSSLGLLVAQAREEGVDLRTTECYRPLDEQVEVRQQATANGNASCASSVGGTSSQPQGHSMHGWGKATDLNDAGQTGLAFGSPGYQFMKRRAAAAGWNHPGWAEPHGSSCPEPWHWEWVGDGGILGDSPVRADVVTMLPASDGLGYSIVTGLGAVYAHGQAPDLGSLADRPLGWLVVAAARTPNGGGYWLLGADGSVYNFGDAGDFGSTSFRPPAHPIVGIAASADGAGYWVATSAGNVFGFGAAAFHGSPAASEVSLDAPIVAIVGTPDGGGYWLAGADGRVFAYGDAARYGDASARSPSAPVVSMASTRDGRGYWLVTTRGRVFAHGDAPSLGSIPHRMKLRQPITAIASTPDAGGYWLVAADGTIFAFGGARIHRR